MKTTKLIIYLLFTTVFISISEAQISTNKDISTLLKKSEKDSVAQIERLAALEFHKLINEYRKSKGLPIIGWDETLWVATKNHNAWMAEAHELSHHQTKKNKYYTGDGPGDRFDYAAGGDSPNGWSGENALYNYSAFGKNIKEIANNIASRSFTQWQHSPGHNRNMLGKRHVTHGTAFKISNDRVWGTDLFASNNLPYDFSGNDAPLYAKTTKKRSKRFSTFKTKRKLINELTQGLAVKLKESRKEEAKSLAYKLLRKRIKSDETILYSKKTVANTKGFLGLFKKKKYTYALILEENIKDFDVAKVTQKVLALVNENQPNSNKYKLDLGIALRKRKEVVRITLVSILYQPKSALNVF